MTIVELNLGNDEKAVQNSERIKRGDFNYS